VVGISDGVEIAALVRVDELFCGDPAACRVADVNGDGHPDVVELVRATVLANPDTEQAGDVWVSLGGNLPGYPAPPARPAPADQESDGIADAADNCVAVANPGQEDADRDGIGDACELRADTNADGIVNLADLAYLRSKLFTSDPIADLNDDGIVNLLDVAILKNEFLKPPGPSNAIGEPVLEVHGLRHGLVYAPNTRSVWVGGFVRNVRPADLVLRIRSSAATIQPVVAADGWFSAFVAVDPGEFLNPIVIEAERRTPRARTKQRYVAALGESAAMGTSRRAASACASRSGRSRSSPTAWSPASTSRISRRACSGPRSRRRSWWARSTSRSACSRTSSCWTSCCRRCASTWTGPATAG
jgi:hypothetical protein